MTSPAVTVPEANKPFIVHSNASELGLGVVLSQVEGDGEEHPITSDGSRGGSFGSFEPPSCVQEHTPSKAIKAALQHMPPSYVP